MTTDFVSLLLEMFEKKASYGNVHLKKQTLLLYFHGNKNFMTPLH